MNGSNRYLFDTNAIIHLLRGDSALEKLLESIDWFGVSIISQLEFLSFDGLEKEDEILFDQFLDRVQVIGLEPYFDDLISSAISIRKNHKLKLPDAIIAATALSANATLITADNDFQKVSGLMVGLLKGENLSI
jgi:tRNA(fMet)-specific endonuclease VapC